MITQDEIIETLPLEDFSVNNISDEQIKKHELELANVFLGETFYKELLIDQTGEGTFNNSNFQWFYENYLKVFLSEYILLQVVAEQALRLENNSFANTGDAVLKTLYSYKNALNKATSKSRLLIDSYLTSELNKANFANYLGNNTSSTVSKPVKPRMFSGFYIND